MRFLLLALVLIVSACGVKAPPIAPQREAESTPPNLDCSPSDPMCDKKDPNYRPKGR